MHFLPAIALAAVWAASAVARPEDIFKKAAAVRQRFVDSHQPQPLHLEQNADVRRAAPAAPRFLNSKSRKFVVNGTGVPDVDFDLGESYAGLLPISSNANETRKLYFWFFPGQDASVGKSEIGIWFTGGPGCSSLSGLLTENGPVLYQAGTKAPTQNPYSWSRLTNL